MFRPLLLATVAATCLILGAFAQNPPPKTSNDLPGIYNSGTEKGLTPPMTAAEVAAKMKLPPGFKATVFAAEPYVRNPIGMAWDGKGRIYVAENYTYAEMAVRFDLKLRDRILIFEDKYGKFSSRKVFYDQLQRLMSVEVGLGGV